MIWDTRVTHCFISNMSLILFHTSRHCVSVTSMWVFAMFYTDYARSITNDLFKIVLKTYLHLDNRQGNER